MIGLALATITYVRAYTSFPDTGSRWRSPLSANNSSCTSGTTAPFTAPPRSTVLGWGAPMVDRLGERPDYRPSGDGRLLAPRQIPTVLAPSIPTARSTEDQ